ncbi:MobV family relaxase [Clostridium lundense]|uniref:MobV family relaxase n=1 Tax=Clostridium lundense TaxID=319475 RepID=UPI0004812951|nr:MobV family relaxase [Clostridium lundense]
MYAILRFAKHKGGPAKPLQKHHEREKEAYNSNPDIDINRSSNNYHIIKCEKSYYYEIQSRIENAKCKVRSDSVKFVDTFVGASPQFFKDKSDVEIREYFERAVNFLKERIGEENIFSAVVHLDEKTPHMHLCFVPLTQDKRLSAKDVLGNRVKMTKWQDDFFECMHSRWNEFERGEPAIETKRKHIPVRLFKQATSLNAQMEEIRNIMKDINVFNAGKKKTKVIQLLEKWYPKAISFNKSMEQLVKEKDVLMGEVKAAKKDLENMKKDFNKERSKQLELINKLRYTNEDLAQAYEANQEFIEFIPENLRRQLFNKFNENKQKQEWENEI